MFNRSLLDGHLPMFILFSVTVNDRFLLQIKFWVCRLVFSPSPSLRNSNNHQKSQFTANPFYPNHHGINYASEKKTVIDQS